MAFRRRHISELLQLLVTLFLLCDARSSKYCEYTSFINDIVLESCVRREIATKVNANYRIKGSTSHFTEYTDIWAKCFEVARGSFCNVTKQYNRGVLDLKMHILNVWSELDELLDSTRNKDSIDEKLCLGNFRHSIRTCLPIIKAYALGLNKADLKVLRHFIECLSMEINSCDEATKKIILEVMEKNVLGRVLVSGDSAESLKECLEVFNEKKLEKCAPGLPNFLLKVTYEDLIISVDSITLLNNSCIQGALKECDIESLKVISELAENFLNTSSLFQPSEMSFRHVKMVNFILMPDDREEIRECLRSSLESEVNTCVPGLFSLLESIAIGEPQEYSFLRSFHQRTTCLGIAFRRCPGSTRFIMQKTIQALYETTLDIPFDRNSILSRPGQYESHILEVLFPYYSMSDRVAKITRDCLAKTVCKLGACCGQLPEAMVNVFLNKSLPFPISQKSDCIEQCYRAVFSECSEEGASYSARLLYSVKLAYSKLEALGITHLPMKRPYKLPAEIFESINLCMNYVNPATLENCCPGIVDTIHAYVRNGQIPIKFVTPRSCKYECVLYATSVCDITSASHLQSFIAIAIKMYESIPSTSALVQQEDSNFGIEQVNNRIYIPQNYVGLIETCINNISTQLNSCCPILTSAILDVLNNKPVESGKEEMKWCTKFCYEPVFLQCRRPEIMLQLGRTILDVVNSTWDDVLFIVVFPSEPPYRLPSDVITGVRLCLKMVENLESCCPLLPTALRTVIEDRPWISQFDLMECEASCYKYEINQCPAESRDITLGLVIGLIHFNEISVSIHNCLQVIKDEFTTCCPLMIEIIFQTFMENEHCTSPDQLEKKCDILCTMASLRKCEVIEADIVQKVMKYVFEYEPICLDERNTKPVVYKTHPNLDQKDENKGEWIEENKKTTNNFLVTTLTSEHVSETTENFGKRIQNKERKEILGDVHENNATTKLKKTVTSRRFVDTKSTYITESSNEKQSNSQYNTISNTKMFTELEFSERKSNVEGSYHGYSTEESEIADDKHSDKLIISQDLTTKKDKRLKSTVKYQLHNRTADLEMEESLRKNNFNDEEKRNEHPNGITEPGFLNFYEDKISRDVETMVDTLYDYDVSIGRTDKRDFNQAQNAFEKKDDADGFGLTLGTDDITTTDRKRYTENKDITVFPGAKNGDGKDGNSGLKRKDDTKKNIITSGFGLTLETDDIATTHRKRYTKSKDITVFPGAKNGDGKDGNSGLKRKDDTKKNIITSGFGLILETDDISITDRKKHTKSKDVRVFPGVQNGDGKDGNLTLKRKDDTEKNDVTSRTKILPRQNENVNFVTRDGKGYFNETKKVTATVLKVGDNNFSSADDFRFSEAINNEDAEELEAKGSVIKKVNKISDEKIVTNGWNTVSAILGWNNVVMNLHRISIIENINTPHPNAEFFKVNNKNNMSWKSSSEEEIDSDEAIDIDEEDDSSDYMYFDEKVDIKKLSKIVTTSDSDEHEDRGKNGNLKNKYNSKDSSKKLRTKSFTNSSHLDLASNGTGDADLISDEINFATIDEVSTYSGDVITEASDYDSAENIETANESVVTSKSYANKSAAINAKLKNAREFDEYVVTSIHQTPADVDFTAKKSRKKNTNHETTTVITHIRKNANVEIEIKNDYMNDASVEYFMNSQKLKKTGRKRRIASGYLPLKRNYKYAKLIKLTEKNKLRKMYDKEHRIKEIGSDYGDLDRKIKTVEHKETTGLLGTNISKKIGIKHTKEIETGNSEFPEINVIRSNISSYSTVNDTVEISTSEVIDSETNKKIVKDNFTNASKIIKIKILHGDEINSSRYMSSTHETFDDSSKSHTEYEYKILPHETITENTKEIWKNIDKNVVNKGLGINAKVGMNSFSDSKSIQANEAKNAILSGDRLSDVDLKYKENKDVENANSNSETKLDNILADQDLEIHVKSNIRDNKRRNIVLKRSVPNDDIKMDNNMDNPHSLGSEALQKINLKYSSETLIQPPALGSLMNIRTREKEPSIFFRRSVNGKSDIGDALDNHSESDLNSGFETLAKKKNEASKNGRKEKGRLISYEMTLKGIAGTTDKPPAFSESSRDEEDIWPHNEDSFAEIGIIDKLPSLYGKLTFRDEFVFLDADGDPSSGISPLTVEAESSVIRCTKVMSPILMKCCRPLLESLYSVINDEKRPLDGPNIKRCNHFCYKTALEYCSPKAAHITSTVIRKIKRYPLLGDAQFGLICNKTINIALNDCCDLFVLNFYEGNYNFEVTKFKEPECSKVCQKNIFRMCFRFKPFKEYFKSLIRSYIRKKNIVGLYAISPNSRQNLPIMKNPRLISKVLFKHLGVGTHFKKRYGGQCNQLSNRALDNVRHTREVVSGMTIRGERKLNFDGKEEFRIPAYFKKLARKCIYMIQDTSLDNCLPGMYDYILLLSNGVETNPPNITDVSKASACFSNVFKSCPTESILVLNSLVQQFFDESITIINTTLNKTGDVDEKTKRMINICLKRAGSDPTSNCIKNFSSIVKEILNKGQSSLEIDMSDEDAECLSEMLSVCSLKARIILMRLILEYKGVLLKISFIPQTDVINIKKLISGEERRSFMKCFGTLNREELDICEPELYSFLSELVKGSIKLRYLPLSGSKECLRDVFKECSFHSRQVIMDLVLFATDNSIDIPVYYPKETPFPITREEQNVVRKCLSQLNASTVEDCLPGLMYVLNEVYENNIPDLNRIPVLITSTSCLEDSFVNCSAHSRLFLTELVLRYTNVFVDLLFFISKDNIDRNLLNTAKECIATIPVPLIKGCVPDLIIVTEKLSSGLYPLSQLIVNLKERKQNCLNDLLNRCNRYHRILIDQLMRKLTRSITNTDMFDILHPSNIYSGSHQHTLADRRLVQQCFETISENYLNWCVPGLYESIRSLTNSDFPISVTALKPIEGSCLDMAFAECSYKSRILIKDLLYDFAYLFVNISLHGAPQGQTGELGPPLDAIQECILSVNSTGSDSCVLGIIASLHKVFIEKVENPQPIVSPNKEKTSMACLAELFTPCDLPVKVFLLKRIADISNVKVKFIMETYLIKSKRNKMMEAIKETGAQAETSHLLQIRKRPLENNFEHRANFAANSEFSGYPGEFGKPDTYWYDKLRFKGLYLPGNEVKRKKTPRKGTSEERELVRGETDCS